MSEGQQERLNGAELYFEDTGPVEADKPALVYLHGGPGYNSYSFQEVMGEALSDWRVIYLDQRGAGRSASLIDTEQGDETLSLDTLVADVEALRDYLDIPHIIPVGHGFGALIALDYARRYPQHTARVVVVNPWLHFPQLTLTLLREASAMRGVELDDPAPALAEQMPENEYPPIGQARLEAAGNLVHLHDLLNALHYPDPKSRMRLEFIDAEAQLFAGGEVQDALVRQGLWEFEYPAYLAEMRRPIFVIAGVHDRSSYPEQTDWLVDLADADLTVLDAGHYPWLDDEEEFLTVLEEALTR